MKVDYNLLKKSIIRSSFQITKGLLPYRIDLEKLNQSLEDLGLVAVNNGLISFPVEAKLIPLVSEYFKKQKLEWFNRSRQLAMVTFVPLETATTDPELKRLLALLNDKDEKQDPDFDPVDIVADINAKYPCWNALVVGYQSNDPNYIGRNSYSIVIRANINVITDPNYQYNNEDI